MIIKTLGLFTLAFTISSISFMTLSHGDEQLTLDKECEKARQIALAPRKKEIYQECHEKFKKSEAVCKEEAQAYNGNRINGAPMFYELPECVKAFEYKNKHNQ